jgi:Protein of unknown function (DUF3108)
LRHATTYHYDSQVHANVMFSLRIAQTLVFFLSLTCTIIGQEKTIDTATPFNPAAYRVGERLTYNVDYSQFISAAHVEMYVAGRGNFFGHNGIQLKAHVETTGVVNVALLSMNNDYATYVYADTGLPYRAQQLVREAGRTSEASVDYNQPAGVDALPPKLRLGEFPGTFDVLSALYRIRSLPLAPGSSYFTTIRNENEEYRAEIKVTGKELIKTNVGSFNTIVARVNLKNKTDYDLRVYFSDDELHVPVLLTARYMSGDIRAELAASEMVPPASLQPARPIIDPAPALPTPTPRLSNVIVTQPQTAAFLDLPFRIGEVLNYQVYLGNGNQAIGTLVFSVKGRGQYFNRDGLQFVATAQTGPAAVFAVRDQFTSYVDPETFLPFRTEINFSEGNYRRVRNYTIDQDRGSAITETTRERVDIPVGTHDLLSAFYAIRTFDLTIQKQNAVSIMAVSHPQTLTVKSTRRETLELGGQKIPTIMVTLTTDDAKPDKLQIRIWLGDDARRLPLRIAAVTDLGAVRADLAIVPR